MRNYAPVLAVEQSATARTGRGSGTLGRRQPWHQHCIPIAYVHRVTQSRRQLTHAARMPPNRRPSNDHSIAGCGAHRRGDRCKNLDTSPQQGFSPSGSCRQCCGQAAALEYSQPEQRNGYSFNRKVSNEFEYGNLPGQRRFPDEERSGHRYQRDHATPQECGVDARLLRSDTGGTVGEL